MSESKLETTYTSAEVAGFFRINKQLLNKWRKKGFIRGMPTSLPTESKPAGHYVFLESEIHRVRDLLLTQD